MVGGARVSLLEQKNLVHMVQNVEKKQPGRQEGMMQLENGTGKEDFAILLKCESSLASAHSSFALQDCCNPIIQF